jgi:hypothetical protein
MHKIKIQQEPSTYHKMMQGASLIAKGSCSTGLFDFDLWSKQWFKQA